MIETEPTRELAAMLAMSGRVTSALKVYDTLLGRDGDNAEFWLQKGLLHQDLSDFVAARQALERARAVAPGDARIHFHLGLLAASFGRMLAAVEHFRSAQTLDPDKGAFKVYLANALFVLGRWEAAAAIVEPMGDALPGWWASLRDSAIGALANGRARVHELIALRNNAGVPLERSLALELADLSINVGLVPLALRICERLLGEDGADFEAVRLQVKAVAQSDGIAAALGTLDAAKAQFEGRPDYEMAVAQVCFEAEDLERAVRHAAMGKDADRQAYGRMLLAARQWRDLFDFSRSWMGQTDDTGPFVLFLRALAGLGRLRVFRDDMRGQARAGTIPPVIVQFWDSETAPTDVAAAIATWREQNRGFEHRLFNEATARAFIERTHGARAVVAFDRCHNSAMKADFFRVAYLVAEGGLYIEADDACLRPLVELLGAIGGADFAASFSGDVAPYVHNCFVAAAPGAPILKLALADMIDRIDRAHVQGIKADIWHTTGPGLITRSVPRWLAENPEAGGDVVFLTTRQYRGFARSVEDLEGKMASAGKLDVPVTETQGTPMQKTGFDQFSGLAMEGRVNGGGDDALISTDMLAGRSFRFGRLDGSVIGHLELAPGGTIAGHRHPNESAWSVEAGKLVFRDDVGVPSTVFSLLHRDDGLYVFRGEFLPRGPEPWHTLDEVDKRPVTRRILDELRDELYGGDSPLAHSDPRHEDTGYPHTNLVSDIVESVLDVVRPSFWLELGSMLGGSAIRLADTVKRNGLDVDIVCVDPFTGDVNMWAWEQPKRQQGHWQFLRLERGRPSIYDRFLANVTAAGHADIILPIAATSIVGIKLLRRLLEEHRISSLPSVIYLDSAHEPDETLLELQNCWALLEPGSVLMGDDWNWPAVRNDVRRFVKTVSVNRDVIEKLVLRHSQFIEEGGVLLDRGQWVIAK
ncbi:MAG: tetratricopeptide repeat protein [Pseudomonadota bacterium]|jgi:tetratricopeptide (TPR) repeat protein